MLARVYKSDKLKKHYMNRKLEVAAHFITHSRYLHFVCLSRCRTAKYYLKVMGRPYYPLSFEASVLKNTKNYYNKILLAYIGSRIKVTQFV